MSLLKIREELKSFSDPRKARVLQGFFKTGFGQYGYGDIFWGVAVPDTRRVAKKYLDIGFSDIAGLLHSKIHEQRLLALIILVLRFSKADEITRREIYGFYLKNVRYVNNWDLVDSSAKYIVGAYVFAKDNDVLLRLAKSKSLWERRIAIIATFYFIENGRYDETFLIAGILLDDKHDLIHKAVGWMLREVGKRNQAAEEDFLRKHCRVMPRTMLRYAIERFEPRLRKFYLCPDGKVEGKKKLQKNI